MLHVGGVHGPDQANKLVHVAHPVHPDVLTHLRQRDRIDRHPCCPPGTQHRECFDIRYQPVFQLWLVLQLSGQFPGLFIDVLEKLPVAAYSELVSDPVCKFPLSASIWER